MRRPFWELEQHGSARAFVQEDGAELTYMEAAERCDALTAKLGKRKRLVAIICDNDFGSVIAYLACLRGSHVPLLLNAATDNSSLKKLCDCYRPHYICHSEASGHQELNWLEQTEYFDETPIYHDLALLLTTSGSTGSQKLVRLSYRNLQANAASIATYLELASDERAISVLPINYSYGLSVINSHLLVGAQVVLTKSSVIQKSFWVAFREHQVTSLVGVPYTYDMYLRIGLCRLDLPSLRYMTQAGGKLNSDRVKQFANWAQERGVRFFVMYGQTEATARMSYLPHQKAIDKSASVGRAIPGGQFSILDCNGSRIEQPGLAGELVYRGANVSLGYAGSREDLSKGDENFGVLFTGDIATYDEGGLVYIQGRLKRFIKIAGNRMSLDDIEDLLRANGIEGLCGGADDSLQVAVQRKDDELQAKQIINAELRLHPTLYRVSTVTEVPRNSAGKVQYSALFNGGLGDD